MATLPYAGGGRLPITGRMAHIGCICGTHGTNTRMCVLHTRCMPLVQVYYQSGCIPSCMSACAVLPHATTYKAAPRQHVDNYFPSLPICDARCLQVWMTKFVGKNSLPMRILCYAPWPGLCDFFLPLSRRATRVNSLNFSNPNFSPSREALFPLIGA